MVKEGNDLKTFFKDYSVLDSIYETNSARSLEVCQEIYTKILPAKKKNLTKMKCQSVF